MQPGSRKIFYDSLIVTEVLYNKNPKPRLKFYVAVWELGAAVPVQLTGRGNLLFRRQVPTLQLPGSLVHCKASGQGIKRRRKKSNWRLEQGTRRELAIEGTKILARKVARPGVALR